MQDPLLTVKARERENGVKINFDITVYLYIETHFLSNHYLLDYTYVRLFIKLYIY